MHSNLKSLLGSSLVIGVFLCVHPLLADDWPQWLGPQRDAVWRETGIMEKLPADGPPVRWRTPIGAGYAGPAVANGKVYLTDRQLAEGASNPANPFDRGTIPGTERTLCLNEADGKILWQHKYDCPYTVSYPAGPRATPVIGGGKVYTLGTEGHLFCLDAISGKPLWSHDFKKDYGIPTPMWGFSAHPLLDGNKLICLAGGDGSTAVAFDKDSGKELWRALTAKEPGYCPPMIFEAGGKRQLVVWHPEAVNSLDPETGMVYWSHPCKIRSGMTIPTPRKMGDLLYLTCFYNGSIMLRLDANKPAATEVWASKKVSEKDTDALHSTMSTPFLEDGYIYGVCSYGQLRCLKADTGERVWETLKATTPDGKEMRWANAFLVKNGDRFFLFNEKGDLIIAKLSPKGYEEISRAHLLEPTNTAAGRDVLWSHPAFANRSMYARNDKEIISVSLAATK
ncbi:MAG: PQQ-like beta-propeller repeat protein [Verrucomicrobia bacterium]|nr:PQQ-like beta-propeller repeat protein [Verrucomicrobiota bacterium]